MDERQGNSDPEPVIPAAADRMVAVCIAGPHPATLDAQELLSVCDLRTQRRSGPGGQHRNKTSSGVFLQHRPSGIVAEATERRSQAENRDVALQRLRFRLAIQLRSQSVLDGPVPTSEVVLREKFRGKSLRMNQRNESKPAVLSLIVNDLYAAGGQPSVVAPLWSASTSGIVAILKSHAPALVLVNAIRQHHGRGALR